MRGTMSDETGTIEAQVDNGDGTFGTIPGVVERNNTFWIENVPLVPLNGHSPIIQVKAIDASGNNPTTTSLTADHSAVTLTIRSTSMGMTLGACGDGMRQCR